MSRHAVPVEAPDLPADPAAPEAGGVAFYGKAGQPHARSASGQVWPLGEGETASYAVVADEPLPARALVRIYDDAGTLRAALADVTAEGGEGNAFVQEAIAQGATGQALRSGTVSGFAGLAPWAHYYASTTPGAITADPARAPGNVIQQVAVAVSATALRIEFGPWPITIA